MEFDLRGSIEDKVRLKFNFFLQQVQFYESCIQLEIVEEQILDAIQEAIRYRNEVLLCEGYRIKATELWQEWHEVTISRHPIIRKFFKEVDLLLEDHDNSKICTFSIEDLSRTRSFIEALHSIIRGILIVSKRDDGDEEFYSKTDLAEQVAFSKRRRSCVDYFFDNQVRIWNEWTGH